MERFSAFFSLNSLMPELTIIQQIAVWIIPVLFAITFHEAAHAWVANKLGDNTAMQLGRLSFNPVNHIDPVGSVVIPIATLILSNFSFVFGWAKPVPINSSNFSNPRRDLAIATAAGPVSNLLMAFLWAGCMKLILVLNAQASMITVFVILAAKAGILINLLLAFLNLIPLPPLDGSKIVMAFLSPKQTMMYEKIEPFGFFILIGLMLSGILSWLISPPINMSWSFLRSFFNL